ncbi:MAG: polysaccharide pyruvyl transferase family protein [Thermoanaerobaculaceae bacterium]|nr:polysaccharide pyruvyl transferase family protein [Thermoanaerobaculaceae bacterium]
MARILLSGSYGYNNVGDEAILLAMLRDLRAALVDPSFTVVSGNPDLTRAQHGVDVIHWADWPGIARAVAEADLVLVGGGGILFDYEGFDPRRLCEPEAPALAFYCGAPLLAGLAGKRLMVYAVGAGPLDDEPSQRATRMALSMAQRITVRDDESRGVLDAIGFPSAAVEVTADPAFTLRPATGARVTEALEAVGIDVSRPFVAVVPREWQRGPGAAVWEAALAGGVAGFAAKTGVQVLLVPFHEPDDDACIERLTGRLADVPARVLDKQGDPELLLGVLGRSSLVIGMRLHSVIFAVVSAAPFVAIAYDPKVRQIARRVGCEEHVVSLDALDTLGEVAERVWQSRARISDQLLQARRSLEPLALRNAEIAASMLQAAVPGPPEIRSPETLELLRECLVGRLDAVAARDQRIRELVDALAWKDNEIGILWRRLGQQQEAGAEEPEQARAAAEAGRPGDVELLRTEVRTLLVERARQDEALEAARGDLVAAEAQLASSDEELQRANRALDAVREQRDIARAGEREAERKLGVLQGSFVVRLVERYWALLDRLTPPGTRRRRLVVGLHSAWAFLRHPFRAIRGGHEGAAAPSGPAVGASAAVTQPGSAGVGQVDPWHELATFEDAAAGGAAGRVVAIFSATKLDRSEGQRPTQLAIEMASRGITVVFAYWRWWPDEWCQQDWADRGIVQIPIDVVVSDPARFFAAFPGFDRTVLFEFPHPDFFAPVAAAHGAGWSVGYDVLDDWEEFHRVGQAIWYDQTFERHLLHSSDGVFTINRVLADHVRALGRREVEVVGNGVRLDIAVAHEPCSLERGEVTVGYFGYLAGAWFDWDLLAAAAGLRPTWRFYLIGYAGDPDAHHVRPNIHLLGKMPQFQLASHAAIWDVAVVPFKRERLARGADPIKTYEYLAMGLPVVVTGVGAPAGAEHLVLEADTPESFVARCEEAARTRGSGEAARRGFAEGCTWAHRVDAILESVAAGHQQFGEKRALFAGSA